MHAQRPLLTITTVAAAVLMGCSPADSGDDAAAAPTSSASSPSTTASPSASSPSASSPTASASASAPACDPASLRTRTAGKLTWATDKPAYGPWFVDDEPENGQGFEGAVAAAVTEQLGYAAGAASWTRVKFDAAIAPGPKDFDIDINEFSITPQRAKAVDFSSGYYDVSQAVVTTKKSKAAGVTTIAGLRGLDIGAQVGTTSYDAIRDVIRPTRKPSVYNNNDDAIQALQNGQIDALVVDLPTAFYVTSAQLDDGAIVGQLPGTTAAPEQFGLLLDKGSPLTTCVTAAVDALRADGTLDALQKKWLAQAGGAPALP